MSSMRKLRRRYLRWQRYADRVTINARIKLPWAWQPPHGYRRAVEAVAREQERRDRRYDDDPPWDDMHPSDRANYLAAREAGERAAR